LELSSCINIIIIKNNILTLRGAWADWFSVDSNEPGLNIAQGHYCSDQLIFARRNSRVKDVFIAGKPVIVDGLHPLEDKIYTRFIQSLNRLFA
jgi:cytosine/adenosine deaminase-related metal-dependent hydrolase